MEAKILILNKIYNSQSCQPLLLQSTIETQGRCGAPNEKGGTTNEKLIALLLAALLIIGMTACSTKQTPTEETKTEPAAAESASTAEKSAQQPTEEAPVTITWGLYETDNLTAELWDSVIAAFRSR